MIVIPAQGILQNDPFSYKQVLATLNLCSQKITGSDNSVVLNTKSNTVALKYNPALINSAKVISIKFESEVDKFSIELSQSDGSKKSINIDRYYPPEYHGPKTDYYIPIDQTAKISSIRLILNDQNTINKSVKTALCKA